MRDGKLSRLDGLRRAISVHAQAIHTARAFTRRAQSLARSCESDPVPFLNMVSQWMGKWLESLEGLPAESLVPNASPVFQKVLRLDGVLRAIERVQFRFPLMVKFVRGSDYVEEDTVECTVEPAMTNGRPKSQETDPEGVSVEAQNGHGELEWEEGVGKVTVTGLKRGTVRVRVLQFGMDVQGSPIEVVCRCVVVVVVVVVVHSFIRSFVGSFVCSLLSLLTK